MSWGSDYTELDIDGKDANGNSYGYDYNEPSRYDTTIYSYKYEFNTKEALISSKVFQECLTQALAHKDKQIRDLQNELLNVHFDNKFL